MNERSAELERGRPRPNEVGDIDGALRAATREAYERTQDGAFVGVLRDMGISPSSEARAIIHTLREDPDQGVEMLRILKASDLDTTGLRDYGPWTSETLGMREGLGLRPTVATTCVLRAIKEDSGVAVTLFQALLES